MDDRMSSRVIAVIALCVALAAGILVWQRLAAIRDVSRRLENLEKTTLQLKDAHIMQDEIIRIHRKELSQARTEFEKLKKSLRPSTDSRQSRYPTTGKGL